MIYRVPVVPQERHIPSPPDIKSCTEVGGAWPAMTARTVNVHVVHTHHTHTRGRGEQHVGRQHGIHPYKKRIHVMSDFHETVKNDE